MILFSLFRLDIRSGCLRFQIRKLESQSCSAKKKTPRRVMVHAPPLTVVGIACANPPLPLRSPVCHFLRTPLTFCKLWHGKKRGEVMHQQRRKNPRPKPRMMLSAPPLSKASLKFQARKGANHQTRETSLCAAQHLLFPTRCRKGG